MGQICYLEFYRFLKFFYTVFSNFSFFVFILQVIQILRHIRTKFRGFNYQNFDDTTLQLIVSAVVNKGMGSRKAAESDNLTTIENKVYLQINQDTRQH